MYFVRESRVHYIILATLFVALFFVGTWHLSASPATWFDEGINVGIARSALLHGVYSLEVGPNEFVTERQFLVTTNYPVLLPVATSLKLFGQNLFAARLPMVLFLLLFALVAYLLVKRLYGSDASLLTLALLVSFVPLYGNGKAVLGEVPGLFFLLAGLWCLPSTLHARKVCLAGFLFGLCIATKPYFLLLIPAVLCGEYMTSTTRREFLQRIGYGALGAFLPLAVWMWTILPAVSWADVVSTFGYYSNSYATDGFGYLVASNLMRFISETTPLHFLLLFVISVLGMWFNKKRGGLLRKEEVILIILIVLTAVWYLKTPGWYRYFFPAHVLLFVLFPGALLRIFTRKIAIGVAVGLVVVQSTMLIGKRNDPLYNSTESAVFSGEVLSRTERDASILVVNNPSIAFLLSGRAVYQYLQINPERYFGRNVLHDQSLVPYRYIIFDDQSVVTDIPDLRQTLDARYEKLFEFGHGILYKHKSGV